MQLKTLKFTFFELIIIRWFVSRKDISGGGQHHMNVKHYSCHLECWPHMNLYKSLYYNLGYFICEKYSENLPLPAANLPSIFFPSEVASPRFELGSPTTTNPTMPNIS